MPADFLTTALQVGLPSLTLGTIAAMWLKWHLGRRDRIREERKVLVEVWRRDLTDHWPRNAFNEGLSFGFASKLAYSSLRPHLTDAFKAEIDRAIGASRPTKRDAIHLTFDPNEYDSHVSDYPRQRLIDEIGRIEREWGLV